MKNSTRIKRHAIVLCSLWLTFALPVHSQTRAELQKQTKVLLEAYGLEEPAKLFATFLLYLTKGEKEKAYSLVETKAKVKAVIEKSEDFKYLKVHQPEIPSIDLIGYRYVSNTVVSLLYSVTTKDGPVAIRMDFYTFENNAVVAQIRLTREWDEILALVDTLRQLPGPVEFPVKRTKPSGD